MRLFPIVALAALLVPAHASDANDQHAVLGTPGTMACGVLMQSLGNAQVVSEFSAWTMGYISGLNVATPDTYNFISRPDAYPQNILDVCTAQPNITVADAITLVIRADYEARVRLNPAP